MKPSGKRGKEIFRIQNEEMLYRRCFSMCHQEGPRKQRGFEIQWDISASGLY
jgi:hypothetical protein